MRNQPSKPEYPKYFFVSEVHYYPIKTGIEDIPYKVYSSEVPILESLIGMSLKQVDKDTIETLTDLNEQELFLLQNYCTVQEMHKSETCIYEAFVIATSAASYIKRNIQNLFKRREY